MAEDEIVIFEGLEGDDDGEGWLPSVSLVYDEKHQQIHVVVCEEATGMAEGIPPGAWVGIKERIEQR